jgi:hypothetical protein
MVSLTNWGGGGGGGDRMTASFLFLILWAHFISVNRKKYERNL